MWLRQLPVCLISSPWHLLKPRSAKPKPKYMQFSTAVQFGTQGTRQDSSAVDATIQRLLLFTFLCGYTSNSLGAGLKALTPYSLV